MKEKRDHAMGLCYVIIHGSCISVLVYSCTGLLDTTLVYLSCYTEL